MSDDDDNEGDQMIEAIWCVLDQEGRLVITSSKILGTVPLAVTDADSVSALINVAQIAASASGDTLRLVKFNGHELMREIVP